MDKDTVIKVENVSKKYCKSLKRSMLYGVMDIGKNILGLSSKSDQLRRDEFWALKDISFEVKRGETLGIIGPNGSGKTTLLKLLNGIFWPDKGKIMIKGRVGALIELGAGFHPMLTGKENIYINGAILGMTRKEIDKKYDEIVDFAGIGEFINIPVKYYSSGMFVRLGFAIAVHSEPDILLIDEILSVGDLGFQKKCFERIAELRKKRVTILFVSHAIRQVQRFCSSSMFIRKGSIEAIGDTTQTVNSYYSESLMNELSKPIKGMNSHWVGTGEIVVNRIGMYNHFGQCRDYFISGEFLRIEIQLNVRESLNCIPAITIYTGDFIPITSLKTDPIIIPKGENILTWEVQKVPFVPGVYFLAITIKEVNNRVIFKSEQPIRFAVLPKGPSDRFDGLVFTSATWCLTSKDQTINTLIGKWNLDT